MFSVKDILWNPLDLLNPGKKGFTPRSNYRVILRFAGLQHIIQEEIINSTEGLESLHFHSRQNELILTGIYDTNDFLLAKIFKIRKVVYRTTLRPIWIKNNKVRLKIVSYFLRNQSPKSFDLVYYFSKIDPFHKRKLFTAIVNSFPRVFSLTKMQWEVKFDLNYFIQKVPGYSGKIEVHSVDLEQGYAVFSVESNVMLKPLMDFFGPEYLKLEYLL